VKILGIHDGHSAAAALIENGRVIAAIQEERLTRHKNQGGFPAESIREILKLGNIKITDLDLVAFSGYGKSNVKTRDDIMANFMRKIEPKKKGALRQFGALFQNLTPEEKKKQNKLRRKQQARMDYLVSRGFPEEKICFIEHHLCHASTAYYGQGVMDEEILVITCDAAGDSLCATVSIGNKGRLRRIAEVADSESVAITYSFFTFLLGFVPLEHEYKLMGLAPYSEKSSQSNAVRAYLNSLFRFTESYPLGWERAEGVVNTFRMGPQLKEYIAYKRFDTLSGGLQLFIEDFFIEWIGRVVKETGIRKLALSGGLFMNVKLNKLIMEHREVESVYVFPSCGDETNSIGAAWAAYADFLTKSGKEVDIPALGPVYFGGNFTDHDVEKAFHDFIFRKKVRITPYEDIEKKSAQLLAQNEVVARCKGSMEFGARALGNRSILANAQSWNTVKVINEMIKMRDFWMPFAPSILAPCADDYLVNPKKIKAPYMIMAFDTQKDRLSHIIAATHPYDESCRPQVVEESWNPDYYRLISYYRELTGEGVILNTSFNLHGSPVVYTPADALHVFDNSGLTYLALGNFLIEELG
jgi:carbamoyltransferase